MARLDAETATAPGVRSKDLDDLDRLARLMDTAVRLPVINYRIGLDGLLGLVPGVGDAAALLPALYILYKARQHGVPKDVFLKMIVNTGTDTALGAVPLIGDLFDLVFKSNRRNVELLRRHLERKAITDVTPT